MSKPLGDRGSSMEMEKVIEPNDDYNIAYIVYLMLGICYVIPWNVFVTAADYFNVIYQGKHVDRAFTMAYMVCSLLSVVTLALTRSWSWRPSARLVVNFGLSIFICCLMVAPALDLATAEHHGRRPKQSYLVMLSTLAVVGIAEGLVSGSIVGMAGMMPKRYIQAVFAGNASSGVLVTILRIGTKGSIVQTPKGLRTSTHIYFAISAAYTLVCIVCYNILEKLPIINYYRHITSPSLEHNSISTEGQRGPTSSRSWDVTEGTELNSHSKFRDVLKRIKWLVCGVSMISIVTLSIFPGYVTEDVHSKHLKDWYPILLISAYNISDLAGKCMTAAYIPKGTKGVIWFCFLRFLFYPLFYACLHGPKFLRTEVPVILITCALGLTNGYLTSVLMIVAPKSVPSVQSESAGTIMLSFLMTGMAIGSVIGWFWVI